jgi:hypothetical protein
MPRGRVCARLLDLSRFSTQWIHVDCMSDVVHKLIVAAAMTTLRSRLLSESTLVGICFLLSVSYHVLCTPGVVLRVITLGTALSKPKAQ